VLEILSA